MPQVELAGIQERVEVEGQGEVWRVTQEGGTQREGIYVFPNQSGQLIQPFFL